MTKLDKIIHRDTISFDDYFDLDEGELVEHDSVPQYSQPYMYVDIPIEELVFVKVDIVVENNRRTYKQTFWNSGRNVFTETTDYQPSVSTEIIIALDKGNGDNEIIRLYNGTGIFYPIYHGFFTKDSTDEEKLDMSMFIDLVKHEK
ncbi:hypothetical protein [Sphingobacterium yanglingense]|uniref:Uncharacterized protein n=1 Tax=Sphingobacterium yanglingense TaxID=1437280 RepID=A0A4R6WQW3_9SPHI|nr:hypothetical protein [Sphingobacterium yanglingense]TDQ81703.1 hypothetical protein CLV99_0231 [Sphingobacterium yanglingense]